MIEFIKHGKFILRLKSIKYAKIVDEKFIEVLVDEDGKCKSFSMEYNDKYSADVAFESLSMNCEAWTIGYQLTHPFIECIRNIRTEMYYQGIEIKKLSKEISLLRKQLKADKK